MKLEIETVGQKVVEMIGKEQTTSPGFHSARLVDLPPVGVIFSGYFGYQQGNSAPPTASCFSL